MENLIVLKNLNKTYNLKKANENHVLKDINLEIHKGEALSIMGVSGSGKTTLLNIIGCLDNFDTGTYILNNQDVSKANDFTLAKIRSNFIGYVLQEYSLINKQTVYENVVLPLCLSNKYHSHKACKERVFEVLKMVGIMDKMKEKVINLSGGQRQRVAIARAMINDPEILLADEPTAALDSNTKKEIMELFISLNKLGKTIIIVTHDKEVASYFNKVLYIKDGKINTNKNSLSPL
jgi:ABC-type antimicrobial peptide transport system, ATPase component